MNYNSGWNWWTYVKREMYMWSITYCKKSLLLFLHRGKQMKSLFPRISHESHHPKLSWSLGVEKKVDASQWWVSVFGDLGKRESRD